jgi:uncharacterized membrane protein
LVVVVPVVSGQGGCKIKCVVYEKLNVDCTQTAPLTGGRSDDSRWILGLFYYNPDDPAYIIEDRFGSNLGFNFSRLPVKIGVVIGLVGLIVLYVWLWGLAI